LGGEKVSAPSTAWTRRRGTPACFAHIPHRRLAGRAGAAVLGRPAPLLEPTHDHDPAALRQRLGRMLGLVAHPGRGRRSRLPPRELLGARPRRQPHPGGDLASSDVPGHPEGDRAAALCGWPGHRVEGSLILGVQQARSAQEVRLPGPASHSWRISPARVRPRARRGHDGPRRGSGGSAAGS
jgi:hypothetical protein